MIDSRLQFNDACQFITLTVFFVSVSSSLSDYRTVPLGTLVMFSVYL